MPPSSGRGKPKSNRACLHALLCVLIAGIGRELLPQGFSNYKAVQRRSRHWTALDCFQTASQQSAGRYVRLHGNNWYQVLRAGSKKAS